MSEVFGPSDFERGAPLGEHVHTWGIFEPDEELTTSAARRIIGLGINTHGDPEAEVMAFRDSLVAQYGADAVVYLGTHTGEEEAAVQQTIEGVN
jgi:hypothetical protein